MSRGQRALVLLGVALIVLALIYFGLARRPEAAVEKAPQSTVLLVTKSQEPSRGAPSAEPPRAAEPAPVEPIEQATAPVETFAKPETEEDYWTKLEALKKTDKKRALAYAFQGEEWYAEAGKPAEARRAMIVTLMVDLGQMEQARERSRDFIKLYPDSPYRRLVQGVTGIHPRPGAPPGHQ